MQMPEPTDSNSKSLIQSLDLKTIAEKISGAKPLSSAPNRGVGKKSYVPIQSTQQEIIIEFFCESVVTSRPSNLEIGYDYKDVTSFAGVSIFDINVDANTKKRSFQGEVIAFEDFLQDHVEDDRVKWMLERSMDVMREETKPDDSFLEKILPKIQNLTGSHNSWLSVTGNMLPDPSETYSDNFGYGDYDWFYPHVEEQFIDDDEVSKIMMPAPEEAGQLRLFKDKEEKDEQQRLAAST